MTYNVKIAALGGDRRQAAMAAHLSETGFECAVWGLENADIGGATRCPDWRSAICGAAAVVLPLPASADGVRIDCPLAPESLPRLKLTVLLENLDDGIPVLGGKLPERFAAAAAAAGRKVIDYFDSEELKIRNAVPTAEGALFTAMREMDVTVKGSRVAVTGFGRIGRETAFLFRNMGARVTVAARKRADLAFASAHGMEALQIEETRGRGLWKLKDGYDLIINTVPARIFDSEVLEVLPRGTLLIDLASVPGGIDLRAADALGLHAIWALSLPGRYAPVAAGKIIAESVADILAAEKIIRGAEQ